MPPADNTPDFDKMTPEEIMAWMESLAKRQGADAAQFTTSADIEIAEIDPDSVVIDEPGYVPSEGKMKGQRIETKMPPKKVAPVAAPPEPPKAAPPPPPVVAAPPPPPPPAPVAAPIPEPAAASGLSWLESLTADQGSDLPSFDLSSLAADLASTTAPTPAATPGNPVDWLENLAQSQGVEDVAPVQPAAETGDPVSWLESLAKRQGAPTEELATAANVNVPLPENVAADGPGYTEYTFETPDTVAKQAEISFPATPSKPPVAPSGTSDLQDPAAWLDALATSQGASEAKPTERQMSDDEIGQALAKGQTVPHDQMERWMSRQLEIGAQREEPEELTAYDPDAPAVKAEIPDWLLEQVGTAPPEEVSQPTAPPPSAPALIDTIMEPPAVVDMPDWLREEAPSHSELENIFAPTAAEVPAAAPKSGIEIDPNDPWVEALEMEYAQGKGGTPPPPPAAPAAPQAPAAALQEASLQPETELPAGEPEPVPDWLQGVTAEAEAVPGDMPDWLMAEIGGDSTSSEQPAVAGDMPDWLTADIEPEEVPSWLTETLGTSEQVATIVAQPAAAVVPVPAARPPAPVPARALNIDVGATLQSARSHATANNIDGALQNYELLIRANAELDAVIGDLTKLSERVKNQPAVYRVLGDGLMRQGKLQTALDIYRKALNQL